LVGGQPIGFKHRCAGIAVGRLAIRCSEPIKSCHRRLVAFACGTRIDSPGMDESSSRAGCSICPFAFQMMNQGRIGETALIASHQEVEMLHRGRVARRAAATAVGLLTPRAPPARIPGRSASGRARSRKSCVRGIGDRLFDPAAKRQPFSSPLAKLLDLAVQHRQVLPP